MGAAKRVLFPVERQGDIIPRERVADNDCVGEILDRNADRASDKHIANYLRMRDFADAHSFVVASFHSIASDFEIGKGEIYRVSIPVSADILEYIVGDAGTLFRVIHVETVREGIAERRVLDAGDPPFRTYEVIATRIGENGIGNDNIAPVERHHAAYGDAATHGSRTALRAHLRKRAREGGVQDRHCPPRLSGIQAAYRDRRRRRPQSAKRALYEERYVSVKKKRRTGSNNERDS